MMPILDWPWAAFGAVVAAAAIGVALIVGWRRRRVRLARFSSEALLPRLVPDSAWRLPWGRSARLGGGVLLAGLAFAGPRWGEEETLVRGDGVDMVLALDASLSMTATDERPSRLARMTEEVRRLRAQGAGDRVAVLAFAGRSYILTPLTVDDGALELFLDNLDPSIVGQAGSSLARTITQGIDLLQATQSGSDRALIVMSDGEAFEPEQDIVDAAAKAAQARVALITVGFGTATGSTIPIRDGNQVTPKRDDQGNVVITRYHPETLRAAAEAAHGTFIDAAASDKAARIRQALQSLHSTGRSVQGAREYRRRFQLFLLPAVLLLLLDTWLSDRRRRRPTAVLVATTLLVAVQGCGWRNDYAGQGTAAFRARRYPQAVSLYRYAISGGDARPEMMYNLGTALVAADSLDGALEPLERALKAANVDLSFRALFNGGLAHLRKGLAGVDGADSTRNELSATLATYKRALLILPEDPDAKWNYELALRKQKQGGGGGGGGDAESSSAPKPDQSQDEHPSGGLGQQQAEQLLNSAAREERGVQGKKQKQSRPQPPPGGKDW